MIDTIPFADSHHRPLTRIIATIGPATTSEAAMVRLIEAGARVFRFNFSHGTLDEHTARLERARSIAVRMEQSVAILGDLQGPKIRIGEVVEPGIEVAVGDTVALQRDPIEAPVAKVAGLYRLSTTYQHFVDEVEIGQRVLINDGEVRMLAIEKSDEAISCRVVTGGLITSRKGINLPDTALQIDSITARDWKHVEWAIEHEIDLLAISFVRHASDVRRLADGVNGVATRLDRLPIRLPLIAKIETPGAVANIESIADVADGIMIARGDLGVEMDLAVVPVIQRQLINVAQSYGKPCIVATQMLESMIERPSPTRAEANDVATAIMDQVDAVMLSGETAVGRHPALAVEHMARIALATERYLRGIPAIPSPPARLVESGYRTAALAHGVWTVAQDVAARCIVVWSQEGGGARYLSQNGFHIPILAVTANDQRARQMQLLRGVTPICRPVPDGLGAFTRMVDEYLLTHGWAQAGDACILVAGAPLGRPGITNSLAIHVVGNAETGFAGHDRTAMSHDDQTA